MSMLWSSSKHFNLDGHGLSISNSCWSMRNLLKTHCIHVKIHVESYILLHYIAYIFQRHHSAAEYLNFTHIHAHVNMYRNNRVCKQSTATEGCHLSLTSIKKEAKAALKANITWSPRTKHTHNNTSRNLQLSGVMGGARPNKTNSYFKMFRNLPYKRGSN